MHNYNIDVFKYHKYIFLEEISSEGNKTEGENGFNKLVKELTASTIDFAKACFDVRWIRSIRTL